MAAIRKHLKFFYGVSTSGGMRWHKAPGFDPEYLYNNILEMDEGEIRRYVRGTFYEEFINENCN